MKQLLMMRHAKSAWGASYATDFERPLNRRGRRDAPRMGAWLLQSRIMPDLILSSPAERARQTVAGLVERLGYGGEIAWERRIYAAHLDSLLEVIGEIADVYASVLLVGHNPGFSDCVAALTRTPVQMSTAAIVGIELAVDEWSAIRPGRGILMWHITPKTLP